MNIPTLPGYVHVEVDEPLDGFLYFGSYRSDMLDHWLYIEKPQRFPIAGQVIPGAFEKSIVLSLCVSIDEERRFIEEKLRRPIRVQIVNGLPVYLKDDDD
jgi:hypothetical protein